LLSEALLPSRCASLSRLVDGRSHLHHHCHNEPIDPGHRTASLSDPRRCWSSVSTFVVAVCLGHYFIWYLWPFAGVINLGSRHCLHALFYRLGGNGFAILITKQAICSIEKTGSSNALKASVAACYCVKTAHINAPKYCSIDVCCYGCTHAVHTLSEKAAYTR
jgi:hypothetical protein